MRQESSLMGKCISEGSKDIIGDQISKMTNSIEEYNEDNPEYFNSLLRLLGDKSQEFDRISENIREIVQSESSLITVDFQKTASITNVTVSGLLEQLSRFNQSYQGFKSLVNDFFINEHSPFFESFVKETEFSMHKLSKRLTEMKYTHDDNSAIFNETQTTNYDYIKSNPLPNFKTHEEIFELCRDQILSFEDSEAQTLGQARVTCQGTSERGNNTAIHEATEESIHERQLKKVNSSI